ncbi:hypothetical protein SLS62_005119 [Diatrype stigma]|uniref:F-box domain-containing protein n=1 Tax=Diatrype stigma TaxID=117547 RepID=A0AAN9YT56_9PEZI
MERAQQRAAIIRPLASLPLSSMPASPDGATSVEPVTGLGRIAIFPNEVVMVVLQQCSLHILSRVRLVNRAFDTMVQLLPDYDYVVNTVRGIMRRATPSYRDILSKLQVILTFRGLRYLLMSRTCEICGGNGESGAAAAASLRLAKVKVLCDKCNNKGSRSCTGLGSM